MELNNDLIYGEELADLIPALGDLRGEVELHEDWTISIDPLALPPSDGSPLARALDRAEALLLIERAMEPPGSPSSGRTADERRVDAFGRVFNRCSAVALRRLEATGKSPEELAELARGLA